MLDAAGMPGPIQFIFRKNRQSPDPHFGGVSGRTLRRANIALSLDMADDPVVTLELGAFRAQLDALDHVLLEVLARRRGVVEALFDWKRAHGLPLLDPAREAALLDERRAHAARLGVPPETAERVFRAILDGSHDQQR